MAADKDNDFDALDDFDLDADPNEISDNLSSEDAASGSTVDEAELEQYGVWVKVKPETVEDTMENVKTGDLADLDSTDTTLTEEEERLLSELEDETIADDVGLSEQEVAGLAEEIPEEETENLGGLGTMPSAIEKLGDIENDEPVEIDVGEELPELSAEKQDWIEEIEVPLSEDILVED